MSKKKILVSIAILVAVAILLTMFFYQYTLNITQVIRVDSSEPVIDTSSQKKPVVYIGVISRYPPNIIFRGYQSILDYLTSNSSYRFELKLSDDYDQAVRKLVSGEVSAAFLGSYVYVKAHKDYGVIPILKPLNENFEPFSRSALIVKSSSRIYNLQDLKNKRLALPSKESFSSNWILKYQFKINNIKPTDLAEINNFPHHQSVIQNVINGIYDAGATREYLIKKNKDKTLRVILFSEPNPTSPIVVAKNYSQPIVDAIKNILLRINEHNIERGKITKGWDAEFIYGFVEAKDRDYDFIRTINK